MKFALVYFVGASLFLLLMLRGEARVSADSVYYAGSAATFSATGHLSLPLIQGSRVESFYTHWPPMYVYTLSLCAFLGFDPFSAAFYVNLLFVAAGVALLYLLAASLGWGIIAHLFALAVLLLSSTVYMTGSVMAEAVYFFWSSLTLYSFWKSTRSPESVNGLWLFIWALSCTLGVLSRYLGLAAWLSAILCALFLGYRYATIRRAAGLRTLLLLALPVLAFIAWQVRYRLLPADYQTDLFLGRLGPPPWEFFRYAVLWPFYQFFWTDEGVRWIGNLLGYVLGALFTAGIVFGFKRWFQNSSEDKRRLFLYTGLYLGLYIAISMTNRLKMHPWDLRRILQPAYPVLLFLALLFFMEITVRRRALAVKVLGLLLIFIAAVNLNRDLRYMQGLVVSGYNVFSSGAEAQKLSDKSVLASANPLLAYYLYRRPVIVLDSSSRPQASWLMIREKPDTCWLVNPEEK